MNKRTKLPASEDSTGVIQLIGDMKENIEQLVQSINCSCGGIDHFRTILTIYSNKIHKLRTQRDYYKQAYHSLQSIQQSQLLPNATNSSSDISTRQSFNPNQYGLRQHRFKEQQESSNIFQMLNREFVVPVSLQVKNTHFEHDQNIKQSCFNNQEENYKQNPEDSLLISQTSQHQADIFFTHSHINSQKQRGNERTKRSTKQKGKQKKQKKLALVKTFQEFLQQKIEQKHSRQKISEDMIGLLSRRGGCNKAGNRGPLLDRSSVALN